METFLNNAIEKLGYPCKKLLECFYYKRMSWNEIAFALGYKSAASAKNQKYKYLERIRSAVGYEKEQIDNETGTFGQIGFLHLERL